MNIITAITEVSDALEGWYYTKTHVKYIPTSEDLPGTLEFLRADYRGRDYAALRVWSGCTDTSIYARIGRPEVNLIFRLHHDLMHIRHDAGMDLYGELTVARLGLEEFPELSRDAKLLYMIDTAGQTLLHYLTGKHLEDQYAFVSWIWHYMRDMHGYVRDGEYSLQGLQDAVRLYHNMRIKPIHVIGGC